MAQMIESSEGSSHRPHPSSPPNRERPVDSIDGREGKIGRGARYYMRRESEGKEEMAKDMVEDRRCWMRSKEAR